MLNPQRDIESLFVQSNNLVFTKTDKFNQRVHTAHNIAKLANLKDDSLKIIITSIYAYHACIVTPEPELHWTMLRPALTQILSGEQLEQVKFCLDAVLIKRKKYKTILAQVFHACLIGPPSKPDKDFIELFDERCKSIPAVHYTDRTYLESVMVDTLKEFKETVLADPDRDHNNIWFAVYDQNETILKAYKKKVEAMDKEYVLSLYPNTFIYFLIGEDNDKHYVGESR